MAYKKRKRPLVSFNSKRKKSKGDYKSSYDEIELGQRVMSSKTRKRNKSLKKQFGLLKIVVPALLIFTICISLICIKANHPVGLFEYFSSLVTSSGTGRGYDTEIFGGKPIYTVSAENKYFAVTNSSVNCYNKNGKVIFEKSHAYSEPVIKFGDTRYILYGQGEKEISVCTLSETLYIKNMENSIITAAISDSGSYAVATKAKLYDSVVFVYNKNNKQVFKWYASGETVNALSLSADGKTLAVSTLAVKDGKFRSNIYILKFNSADAIMKCSYTDNIVYGIYESGSNRFCCVFSNNIEFIDYKKKTNNSNVSEYSVSVVKKLSNRIIVLRTVAANQDQSVIEIYKLNGKLVSSFKVNNYITDFSYKSGNVYLLGISKIFKYDISGKLMAEGDASFDAGFIEVVSKDKVACIRNSLIEKIILSEVED